MAAKIVILSFNPDTHQYQAALRVDVPSEQAALYASAKIDSAVKSTPATEADVAQDTADLQSGAITERIVTVNVPPHADGSPNLDQAKTDLEDLWTKFQAEVQASQKFAFTGVSWDGSTWVVGK